MTIVIVRERTYLPRTVAEQVRILANFFPNACMLAGDWEQKFQQFQHEARVAEAIFVFPKWEQVAATYCEAVEKVLRILQEEQGREIENIDHFPIVREGVLVERDIKKGAMKIISAEQGGDVIIVPGRIGAADGSRGSGLGYQLPLDAMANPDRAFGLGVFEVGSILLTHPERFTNNYEPGIACVGDKVITFPRENDHKAPAPVISGHSVKNPGLMMYTGPRDCGDCAALGFMGPSWNSWVGPGTSPS